MESGLRAGPIPSGVPVAYLAWMSMLLRYRGRFPWWGNFVFLGTKVPWGVSSEEGGAAHGPLHPAMYKSLETFMALLAGFFVLVLVLFFACLFWVIRLSGWFLFGHSALQDSTRVGILFGSLSLFLFGVFAGDVFFSFFFLSSLSLSLRRWGNPNPFGVWVSPCDSSSCARTSTSTRSSSSAHTSRSRSRTCFFLSRRRSRGLWSVFGCSRGGVSVRSVSRVTCLVGSGCIVLPVASCIRATATPGNGAWPPSRRRLDRPGLPVSCWESTLGRSDLRRVGGAGAIVTPPIPRNHDHYHDCLSRP